MQRVHRVRVSAAGGVEVEISGGASVPSDTYNLRLQPQRLQAGMGGGSVAWLASVLLLVWTASCLLDEAKEIVDEAKDNATSGILDEWTDLAEQRAWFLFEAAREG